MSVENYLALGRVAQWGKGTIAALAYAPNGKTLAVSSVTGVALYNLDGMHAPPRWLQLAAPQDTSHLAFSLDGYNLRLSPGEKGMALNATDGSMSAVSHQDGWLERPLPDPSHRGIAVRSSDGKLEFRGGLGYMSYEEAEKLGLFSEEYAWGNLVDAISGETVYALKDLDLYVSFSERVSPEGCDLSVFSPCGNALMSLALAPYQAAFSASGEHFAVLFRSYSMYSTNRFSLLRVYRTQDGLLVQSFGGYTRPVQDFAFAPQAEQIAVAYIEGSIHVWDVIREKVELDAWHFNAPIWDMAYTPDSRYLVIQRPGVVEVRRVADGSLRSRLKAVAFALSPTENILALGSEDGEIRLLELPSGKTLKTLSEHDDEIYALAFSPDGRLLASSSQDCTARLWEVGSGRFLHYFEEHVENPYSDWDTDLSSRIFVYTMRFIPGTNLLIGFGSWGTAVSWDVQNGALKYVAESAPLEYYDGMITLEPHFPEYFGVDVDARRFYINNLAYDLSNGELAGEYRPPEALPEGCSPNGPRSLDGALMFTRGYEQHAGQVCILDATDFHILGSLQVIPPESNELDAIIWLHRSPDGGQLSVYTALGIVYIYQIVTGWQR